MKFKTSRTNLTYIAWSIFTIVVFLALFVWLKNLNWSLTGISTYQVFPIFGLLAFSIMWSHYVVSFLNRRFFNNLELASFYKITGYLVLAFIVIHPGLLTYQRFRDGFGIPLGSLTGYVQPNLKWVVLLGTFSFFAFLGFELQRLYKDRSWWKYVVSLNDVAIVAIFYHGLKLGSNLHGGWYEKVWLFYGICLIGILSYKYILLLNDTKYLATFNKWLKK